jgi:hypothetical protein
VSGDRDLITRAERVERCNRLATVAGWVAIAGFAICAVGVFAKNEWLVPAAFAVLAPLGVFPLMVGGIAALLAYGLADRYAEPVDEDGTE